MGASLAMALRAAQPEREVLGIDADPETVRKAREREIVSAAGSDLGPVSRAGLVVLAVPLRSLRGLLQALGPLAAGAVVTDVASTKSRVMEWAEEAGVDLVGGHPMCGTERSGIDAAHPSLYDGATWVLTGHQPAVEAMVRAVGARPLIMAADVHDRLAGGVSHAAFVLSAAYVLGLARRPDWHDMERLAGPGFRDMSRLAAGDPEMYAGIAETNREAILGALAGVQAELEGFRRHLEAGGPRLGELFEEARGARARWERAGAGGRQATG